MELNFLPPLPSERFRLILGTGHPKHVQELLLADDSSSSLSVLICERLKGTAALMLSLSAKRKGVVEHNSGAKWDLKICDL